MSDEVSLKEYIERRLLDQDSALKLALAAAEKAVDKAETATDKRFDSVNEFRQQLNDQTQTMLGRHEYQTAHQALIDKIDALTVRIAAIEGHSEGINASWGYLIGGVGLITAIIAIIVRLK